MSNLIEKDGQYYIKCEAHEEVVRRLQEQHKKELNQHSARLVERIENMAIVDDYGEERKIGFQIAKDQAIDIINNKNE